MLRKTHWTDMWDIYWAQIYIRYDGHVNSIPDVNSTLKQQ